MRLFITLFIGLLLLGCKQPEADLEYWHVYAVPTSECHMYSDCLLYTSPSPRDRG